MDNHLLAELMGSVTEANEILKGGRSPSRERHVSPMEVRGSNLENRAGEGAKEVRRLLKEACIAGM